MSEIKVVPQPRWFVKDVSEKFGSPWFHVVGPQGCVTQSADRKWAEETVAIFNESEKRYLQGLAAPAAIEQARPQPPAECDCGERGQDGTDGHRGVITVMTSSGRDAFACENHVKNYRNADWQEKYPPAAAEPAAQQESADTEWDRNIHAQLDTLNAPRSDSQGAIFSINGRFAHLRARQAEPAPTPSRYKLVEDFDNNQLRVYENGESAYFNVRLDSEMAVFLKKLVAEASSLGAKEE